jgi:hypothetical protein
MEAEGKETEIHRNEVVMTAGHPGEQACVRPEMVVVSGGEPHGRFQSASVKGLQSTSMARDAQGRWRALTACPAFLFSFGGVTSSFVGTPFIHCMCERAQTGN